jgi:S-DNA-T family DNA segregation ATPase FtsK/SpoIIIE
MLGGAARRSGDLAQMPHCLIAGTTGSGKSACIDVIIASLLFRFSPDELRFVMIDSKGVDLAVYNGLPRLAMPVVTDSKKVLLALRWVVNEMETRYKIFAKVAVRNVTGFNARPKPKTQRELDLENGIEEPGETGRALKEPEPPPIAVARDDELIIPERMSYIIVIIDGLADLAPVHSEDDEYTENSESLENTIARIVQIGRAAGIHFIATTQSTSTTLLTDRVKSNLPTRIGFRLGSSAEYRTLLGDSLAEKLEGQGCFYYHSPASPHLIRSRGLLITDEEIRKLIAFVSTQGTPAFDPSIQNQLESSTPEEVTEEDEMLVEKCLEIIRQEKRASTSMLQGGCDSGTPVLPEWLISWSEEAF